MGITALNRLIKSVAKRGTDVEWSGKTIAIDANIYVNSYFYISYDLDDFLRIWREKLETFREMKMRAIFIFDGNATPAKRAEQKRRVEEQKKGVIKVSMGQVLDIERANDKVFCEKVESSLSRIFDVKCNKLSSAPTVRAAIEARKNEAEKAATEKAATEKAADEKAADESDDVEDIFSDVNEFFAEQEHIIKIQERVENTSVHKPSTVHYSRLRELIDEFKDIAEYRSAKHEADPELAALVAENVAFCAISRDTDLFAHGCPRVCTEFFGGDFYELDDILKHLAISFPSFLDMCVLMGCDYNRHCASRRGYGPVRSLREIRKYGSLEEMLAAKILNDDQYKKLSEVRDEFCLKSWEHHKIEIGKVGESAKAESVESAG